MNDMKIVVWLLATLLAMAFSGPGGAQSAISPTTGPWYTSFGAGICGVAENYNDAARQVVLQLNARSTSFVYEFDRCTGYGLTIGGIGPAYQGALYNEAPCVPEPNRIESPGSPGPTPWCSLSQFQGGEFAGGPYYMYPERHIECPPGYIHDVTSSPLRHICVARVDDVCRIGDPASPVSGNAYQEELDYSSGGAHPLELKRYYNGGRHYAPAFVPIGKRTGGFTNLWGHTYGGHVFSEPLELGIATTVVRPDGELWHFDRNGREVHNHGGRGGAARIAKLANGSWTLTLANSDVETYDAGGRLVSIATRSGFVTTVSYVGNQIRVADAFGRTLTLTQDSSGRINTLTDPAGGIVTYAYSGVQLEGTELLISATYPDLKTRRYGYVTAAGLKRLTTLFDEYDHAFARFLYDTEGRVSASEHAGGAERYEFKYTTSYRLNDRPVTVVTDPLGQARTFTMNSTGGVYRIASITGGACAACGNIASKSYDANGNVSIATDFRGVQTTYAYDLTRNLETRRTEAAGTASTRTITTSWDSTHRLPRTITEPGRTTSYTYDPAGNTLTRTITDTSVTPNVSRTWTHTYDAIGQVLTEDGPRTDVSDTTVYTYYSCNTGYACGQLRTITNALGQTTSFDSYNAHGQPLTIRDANSVVTTLTYDNRQRLTSQRVAGELTTYRYFSIGLLNRVTLPDGSYIDYGYDKAHRLTQISDSGGNRVVYVLDAMGNRTSESAYDPAGMLSWTRSRVYNSLNQLSKQIGAAGTADVTTTFGYDGNGNQTAVNAPLGRNMVRQFDELNRLRQMTDPGAGVTRLAYDARDNLTSVTDPRGLVTSYGYNGFGEPISQVSPDTGATVSAYDAAGNLKTRANARGITGAYRYDALNRLTSVAYPDQTVTLTYDTGANGVGRAARAADASHSIAWTYDPRGRVLKKTQTVEGMAKTVGYTYTGGNLTSLVTPSGQTIRYGYLQGRINSITVNGTSLLGAVLYQPFGPVRQWQWGNSTSTVRTYSKDMNVARMESGDDVYNFYYDDAFRLTGADAPAQPALSWAYFRDSRDRLTGANGAGHILSWGYDANGSRQSHSDFGAPAFTNILNISATSNRLTSISGSRSNIYAYDNAGNVTSETNPARPIALPGTTTARYTYNALSQRIAKTVGPVVTHFVYDEVGNLLGEYTAAGALIQETVWMEDIPVATLRPRAGGGADIYYVHTNLLNAPRKVTRPADNVVMWQWNAAPFGDTLPEENPQNAGAFAYNLRLAGPVLRCRERTTLQLLQRL